MRFLLDHIIQENKSLRGEVAPRNNIALHVRLRFITDMKSIDMEIR